MLQNVLVKSTLVSRERTLYRIATDRPTDRTHNFKDSDNKANMCVALLSKHLIREKLKDGWLT